MTPDPEQLQIRSIQIRNRTYDALTELGKGKRLKWSSYARNVLEDHVEQARKGKKKRTDD